MFVGKNNEMGFSMADLYPTYGGLDTSTLAVPESDDLEALNEDTKVADVASPKGSSGKSIFLALGIMIALVVFFGGGK